MLRTWDMSHSHSKGGVLRFPWWRNQMGTFSTLLALCAGNSPVTGEFPTQRPVTRSSGVFFDLRLSKRLRKQSRRRWLETPSRSLWRFHQSIRYTVVSYIHYTCLPERLSQVDIMVLHVVIFLLFVIRIWNVLLRIFAQCLNVFFSHNGFENKIFVIEYSKQQMRELKTFFICFNSFNP